MNSSCDLLVVGGGILGLWVAKCAAEAGMDVILVEKSHCGSGASGGVLGALLPHLPNSMTEKNRFQFEALSELSATISELEQDTGITTGYDRCGRLMPIRNEGFLKTAKLCCEASSKNWKNYSFDIIQSGKYKNWVNEDLCPLGLAWDNLAAKIVPQSYIKALKLSVERIAAIREGFEFKTYDDATNTAISIDEQKITTKTIIIAAGYQSYNLLKTLTGMDFGAGVKGQAALFSVNIPEQLPVLYDDGMYVVQHSQDRCAVGSTAEKNWIDENKPEEEKTRDFIKKARALCLPLKNAECIGLWAGVRPRSHAKDPIIGRINPKRNIWAATGGFKITFGIAHRLAKYLVNELDTKEQNNIIFPETYKIKHHIKCGVEMGRFFE